MLTLGEEGALSTLEGVENHEILPCPASYDDQGMKWYPVRKLAEMIGYKVSFTSNVDLENSDALNRVQLLPGNDTELSVTISYGTGDGFARVCMGTIDWSMPIQIYDGRLYAIKELYEVFMNLKVSCYTSFTVFERQNNQ